MVLNYIKFEQQIATISIKEIQFADSSVLATGS